MGTWPFSFFLSRFARAFLWDSGSTVGAMGGIAKAVNSISYKPTRPYRIAVGSEDKCGYFFAGPPFKYDHALKVRDERTAPMKDFHAVFSRNTRSLSIRFAMLRTASCSARAVTTET